LPNLDVGGEEPMEACMAIRDSSQVGEPNEAIGDFFQLEIPARGELHSQDNVCVAVRQLAQILL